jgi:6-phosphogluconolactonase
MKTIKGPLDNFSNWGASMIAQEIQAALKTKNRLAIAVSGGSTPIPVFRALAKHELAWQNIEFFMVDERCVPLSHPNSNYGTMDTVFFEPTNIRAYPMYKEELGAKGSAEAYAKLIEENLAEGNCFDLIFLGMGTDGHTASLFPETHALDETSASVMANSVPQLNTTRITLTYPVLMAAKKIILIATGKEKQMLIHKIIAGSTSYPISKIIEAHSNMEWYTDSI